VHLTPARSDSASGRLSAILVIFGLVAFGSSATPLHADGAMGQSPVVMDSVVVDATKTHVLFMGADIAVNLDRDNYPVHDVRGSNWVVVINGDQKVISAREAPLSLRIVPNLKLAEGAATITGFKRQAAYSYDNDPNVRLTRAMTNSGVMTDNFQVMKANAEHQIDTMSNNALGGMASLAQTDNQFGAAQLLLTAKVTGAIEHPPKAVPGWIGPPPNPLVPSSFVSGGGDYAGGTGPNSVGLSMANSAVAVSAAQAVSADEATGRVATSGLDAMNIEFTVSSPKPLNNPYVVTMTRFHVPGTKPGLIQNLVYARALDPIDSHLTHVEFSEDGFPFNYELVDFQLHLYDRGVEVATNLSANRVDLTRSEAFEYIKLEYLNAHPASTVDATPALGRLPAALPKHLAQGQYATTFFVKVSKDGLPGEAYVDARCQKQIDDPFLVSVVKSIWFKPALAAGKPVDGVAALNLSRLQI
jgi:hypothetical protein